MTLTTLVPSAFTVLGFMFLLGYTLHGFLHLRVYNRLQESGVLQPTGVPFLERLPHFERDFEQGWRNVEAAGGYRIMIVWSAALGAMVSSVCACVGVFLLLPLLASR